MEMEEHQHLPDVNRLSVLTATVMLAYALTPYLNAASRSFVFRLPVIQFPVVINFDTLVSFVVALMAVIGTGWLLESHPHATGKRPVIRHGLIPGLTAWVIGVPLINLEVGLQWWAVFAFGGLLLMMVLVWEYIVYDPNDIRRAPAAVGLTAVSFALFLVLVVALRAAGTRLYLLLPTLLAAIGLTSMRTLFLRLDGRWCWAWSLGIAAAVSQFAVALHYLPLTSLQYGLLLTAPAYALTSLAANREEQRSGVSAWVEPVIMLLILWLLAITIKTTQ